MAKERRRAEEDFVRNNARSGGGSRILMNLPGGVRSWRPEKPIMYPIDVVPYEVGSDIHPDRVAKGMLWWKFPFFTHRNVGSNQNELYVCPGTINKPCPMCQDRQPLLANYDANKTRIQALNAQKWWAFNILDPDDKSKIAVFAFAHSNFMRTRTQTGLEPDMERMKKEDIYFYDVINGRGRTLECIFSESTFDKSKFLIINRIDLKPRPDMDEDKIVSQTVCLDSGPIWNIILPYETLKSIYLQTEAPGATIGEEHTPAPEQQETRTKTTVVMQAPTMADKGRGWKVDDKCQFTNKNGKVIVGKITTIDDQDAIVVDDEDGDDHDVEVKDLEPVGGKQTAKQTPKTQAAPATTSGDWKTGDAVQFKSKKGETLVGKVVDIDGDDVTVWAGDVKRILDKNEIQRPSVAEVTEKNGFKIGDMVQSGTQVGKILKFKGDHEVLIDCDGYRIVDGFENIKPMATQAKAFEPGDEITFDDGDKEGKILKLHKDGTKAKVSVVGGEEEWVPLSSMAHKVTDEKPAAKDTTKPNAKSATKGDKDTDPQCPHPGGKYGRDCDKYNECDNCPLWAACDTTTREQKK